MKELMTYLLEVLACSGILLAAYTILLERRVKFHWCRNYLLGSTLAAAVIPLLRIPVWPGEVIEVAPAVDMPLIDTAAVVTPIAEPLVTPMQICTAAYLLGAGLIMGIMLWQVVRIVRLHRGATLVRCNGFTLVRTPRRIAAFSFFGSVYVSSETPDGELAAILAHERSHITHRHSLERIAMECLKALLWWNPFVWITARRLTEAQEFEADSDVLQSGYAIDEYMNTIFKQLFGYTPEIANGLRDSLTKKRFLMMTTPTPRRHNLLRITATLPILAGLLCAFSFTSRAAVVRIVENPALQVAVPAVVAATQPEAEQPPRTQTPAPQPVAEKPQTEEVTMVFNIRLGDKNIPAEGAIIKIGESNQSVVTDKEGNATLKVPVGSEITVSYIGYNSAKLTNNDTKNQRLWIALDPSQGSTINMAKDNSLQQVAGKPLIIIDGVPTESMEHLNASSVEQMTVLKDKSATDLYGKRAANGVILIVTKGNAVPKTEATTQADQAPAVHDPDAVFMIVEEMPLFQGGNIQAYRQWVMANVRYPKQALDKNIAGRVIVEFVVRKDGSVSDIKVLQTPSRVLSEEVIRVIGKTPAGAWSPGKQRGEKVHVKYTLPVDFNVKTDSEILRGERGTKPTPSPSTAEEVIVVGFGDNKK